MPRTAWRTVENRGKEHPPAAADVNDCLEACEVVRGNDRRGLQLGPTGHRPLEGRLATRMLAEVLEEPLSVGELVRHAASQHRFEQAGGRVVVHLAARDRRTLQRAERLTERTERETSIVELVENVFRRQSPEHAAKGGLSHRPGAISAADFGPSASTSATPSFAAT